MPSIDVLTQNRINKLVRGGRLSHAYIFSGNDYEISKNAVIEFVKALYCREDGKRPCGHCLSCRKVEHGNHEDVFLLLREKNSIGVKQILELLEKLKNKPFASDRIVAIVEDADRMTVQSQNKLLKTLEEPNPGHMIIMISENQEMLLPTIRSRCAVFRVGGQKASDADIFPDWANALAEKLINGAPYYESAKLLDEAITDKDKAYIMLDTLETLCRARFVARAKEAAYNRALESEQEKEAFICLVDLVERARRDLNSDVSYKYTLRSMAAEIGSEKSSRGV
ncbi:MAG: hypothetical protein LBL49_09410 [Clostridiales Family XIII bacterium]|nr:hypothetical protein [Clostridiales Family XIII bacterium]